MRHILSTVLLVCLSTLADVRGQALTQLSGEITDPSGAAVPDATISLMNEEAGFRRLATSAQDGRYGLAAMQPGIYKVMVRKEGFRTLVRFGVKLDVAQPARLDVRLQIGSIEETITVADSTIGLVREDAAVGTLVGRDQVHELPLNGAGILRLLELAPGTVVTPATRGEAGQFTANGQRPNTHGFTLDGVSVNNAVIGGGLPAQTTGGTLPAMTAIGGMSGIVSVGALDELLVQTSSTSSEFGRYPGAQVSLISRSGSNEYRGTLSYLFRNDKLDANDWFFNRPGADASALHMNDLEASFGGPMVRDRTFFYLDYEGLRLLQPTSWNLAVPTQAARDGAAASMRPALDLFPQPNGPGLAAGLAESTGRISRPAQLDSGSLRIDHAINKSISLFGRFQESPSSSQFGTSQVSDLSIASRSLTLGSSFRWKATTMLDVRFNYSRTEAQSVWGPSEPQTAGCSLRALGTLYLPGLNPCNYLYRIAIAGIGQVVSGPESVQRQAQFNIAPTLSLMRGEHQFRFGADIRRLSPSSLAADGSLSIIAPSLDDLLTRNDLWTASSLPQSRASLLYEASLFAQDTWRLRRGLTASFGLRWELAPAPIIETWTGNPFSGPTGTQNRPAWPMRYNNLAPRAGIAWRPLAEGRTVVRAGYGVYYDSSLSLATDIVNGGPLNFAKYSSTANAPFISQLAFDFAQNLRLPRVQQWNASVERAFGTHNVLSVSYAGAAGRSLVRRELATSADSPLIQLILATNYGASDYHGLLVEYRRRMAQSLQATISYSWAHSLDNSSSDAALLWVSPSGDRKSDRGPSDFDVRHSLNAALSYAPRFLRGWTLDTFLHARTGFPVTILDQEFALGLSFANAFRPDLVAGAPVWIADSSAAGGRRLNLQAFTAAPGGTQGNLGRNALTGFGMVQADLAVRRQFRLTDRQSLEFRGEAYNLLNHPNFADPVSTLASPLFGQSPSMLNLMLGSGSPASGLAPAFQTGGARSLQLMLRYLF